MRALSRVVRASAGTVINRGASASVGVAAHFAKNAAWLALRASGASCAVEARGDGAVFAVGASPVDVSARAVRDARVGVVERGVTTGAVDVGGTTGDGVSPKGKCGVCVLDVAASMMRIVMSTGALATGAASVGVLRRSVGLGSTHVSP